MGTKQKILSKAAKLIHSKGFSNTSIQDILDATSVTKSNFYYHFESKEKLAFDILTERIQRFRAYVIEPCLANPDLSPKERIDNFLDRILTLGLSRHGELGCPFGNLAQEMSTMSEKFREFLSEFFGAWARELERVFDEGKSDGSFSETLPSKQLAEFALAQIQGAFLLRKTHKEPAIMQENIDMLRRVIDGYT